jgi:ribonuclease D
MSVARQQEPLFSKLTISNEDVNALPLRAFKGKIVVVSDAASVPAVFKELEHEKLVGFDTETKPVFVKGLRHQVALMQIATQNKAFLIRTKFTGITSEMVAFLESEKIRKAGVGIRDDIKALQVLKKFTPSGFIELAELARQAGLEVESVKKLTALLLEFRISKSAQTSNWEADALDEKQVSYAATDAWVCLKIWEVLSKALG